MQQIDAREPIEIKKGLRARVTSRDRSPDSRAKRRDSTSAGVAQQLHRGGAMGADAQIQAGPDRRSWIERLLSGLQSASTFVEIALVACAHVDELALRDLAVCLQTADGSILVASSLESRSFDGLVRELTTRHTTVREGDVVGIPLVEPAGMMGYLCCRAARPIDDELERRFQMIASYISVRLVQLGFSPSSGREPLPALGIRERQVTELVCAGLTNLEISAITKTSVNTIKRQLKSVFARLDVGNRAELVTRIHHALPVEHVLPGVTQLGNVWITRTTGTRSGHRPRRSAIR